MVFEMRRFQGVEQTGQIGGVVHAGIWIHVELVRVRPAVGLDGVRLSSPDQLCPAQAEVTPSAKGVLGGSAVFGAVPSLHRMDAEAIPD